MVELTRFTRAALSRRRLLRDCGVGAFGVAGAGLADAALARAAAEQRISQQVVAYQDHPNGEKRCDRCTHFEPPTACNVVQGAVSPAGFCRLFVLRQQANSTPR